MHVVPIDVTGVPVRPLPVIRSFHDIFSTCRHRLPFEMQMDRGVVAEKN